MVVVMTASVDRMADTVSGTVKPLTE